MYASFFVNDNLCIKNYKYLDLDISWCYFFISVISKDNECTPLSSVYCMWSLYLVLLVRVYWDISRYGRLGLCVPTCLISKGGFLPPKQCTPI